MVLITPLDYRCRHFLFGVGDWLLTILQERERHLHYAEHYQSYPVNTIEGIRCTSLRLKRGELLNHDISFLPSLWCDCDTCTRMDPQDFVAIDRLCVGFVPDCGYNPFGQSPWYRAGRHGLHGKLYLHQRTGYLMQMGRYLALSVFLILLAVCSASLFVVGVAVGGVSSAADS